MINYETDVKGRMKHIALLMTTELRYAINDKDCEGLEDRMENCFEKARTVVRDVRASIAEEVCQA